MNRLQLLLSKLSEEASEVSQIAMKTQQFGLDSSNPDIPHTTNAHHICKEINDVIAVVEMLNEEFNLGFIRDPALISMKKMKINRYAEFSKDLNLLSND